MLTLAIDTATKVCTIALCRDKEILAEYTINMGMTHSEGLLPQLDQLLQRTCVQKQDIELLAVSMGPGSFTGLRIGLATAEAMAYSWQCCLVSAEKALERIALQGTPALLLGECSKLAKNGLPDFISVAPEALRMPKGSSVALAALAEFDAEND